MQPGSGTDITKPMSAGADNYMFRVSMVDREQIAALIAYVKRTLPVQDDRPHGRNHRYGQGGLKDMQEIANCTALSPQRSRNSA